MSASTTVDAFGNILNSGDTVQLTQQLDVKWTKISLKKGTKVKNIRLTDDIEEISVFMERYTTYIILTLIWVLFEKTQVRICFFLLFHKYSQNMIHIQ